MDWSNNMKSKQAREIQNIPRRKSCIQNGELDIRQNSNAFSSVGYKKLLMFRKVNKKVKYISSPCNILKEENIIVFVNSFQASSLCILYFIHLTKAPKCGD